MCRSEDHFQGLVLSSSLYLGSGDGTHGAGLVQRGFHFSLVPSRGLLIGLLSVGVCVGSWSPSTLIQSSTEFNLVLVASMSWSPLGCETLALPGH